MARLFLIARVRCDVGLSSPFVLNLDGYQSRLDVNRAKNWQEIGQGAFDRHNICVRTGADTFKDVDTGETFTAERGPYTEKAWSEFVAGTRE